jgi:FolB domain-containing protein
MKQSLKINTYEVWVSLGATKEEQSLLQPVHFSITLHFEKSVKGSASDVLDDTINYAALTSHVKQVATTRPYHLIENLCFMTHQHISQWLKTFGYAGELTTEATKVRPPVPSLQGGVTFACQSPV